MTKTEHIQSIHEIIYELSKQGLIQQDIAQAVGYTQGHVGHVLKSIEEQGGISKYRVNSSPGSGSKLTDSQKEQLIKLLKKEAKANGFSSDGWTQKRVQSLIKKEFNVQYSRAYISDLLSALGFSLQVPMLQDRRRDEQEVENFKNEKLEDLKKKRKSKDTQ